MEEEESGYRRDNEESLHYGELFDYFTTGVDPTDVDIGFSPHCDVETGNLVVDSIVKEIIRSKEVSTHIDGLPTIFSEDLSIAEKKS